MNPAVPNPQRRKTLAAALKKVGKDDRMSLEELATIWGTARSRFINVKNEMIRLNFDFPPPEKGPKNANFYPARAALTVMQAYEQRNDMNSAAKDKIIKEILGQANDDQAAGAITISELAMLNREAARAEQRAREEGKVAPIADTSATAARVFSIISNFFSDLDARVDPNGELPKEVRKKLRELGPAAIVALHDELKTELSDDPRKQHKKRARSSSRDD